MKVSIIFHYPSSSFRFRGNLGSHLTSDIPHHSAPVSFCKSAKALDSHPVFCSCQNSLMRRRHASNRPMMTTIKIILCTALAIISNCLQSILPLNLINFPSHVFHYYFYFYKCSPTIMA